MLLVKNKQKIKSFSQQSGFTMVELMIAGVLGIILTTGIIQLFAGSNRNFSLQSELADLQEDGRFAMIFLEHEIEKGGWISDFGMKVPSPVNLALSLDGPTGGSDELAVSYTVQIDGVSNIDCNGSVVADGKISNKFYVGGTSGDELLCLGNGGGAAQPLIDGIERFQVLYGVESGGLCSDGVINEYMTRDQVVAGGDRLIVVSVRVALLMKSGKEVLSNSKSRIHLLLDQSVTTNDKFAYRLFQQTIFMPNSLYATATSPANVIDCLTASVGAP